jgi:hypothetical protein
LLDNALLALYESAGRSQGLSDGRLMEGPVAGKGEKQRGVNADLKVIFFGRAGSSVFFSLP